MASLFDALFLCRSVVIFLHSPVRLNTRRLGVIKKSPFGGFRGLLLRVGRAGKRKKSAYITLPERLIIRRLGVINKKPKSACCLFLLRAGLSAFCYFWRDKSSPKTAMHPHLSRVLSLVFRLLTALNRGFQSVSLTADCVR